jgi:molecular chaperone GrpE (heat shock protein)
MSSSEPRVVFPDDLTPQAQTGETAAYRGDAAYREAAAWSPAEPPRGQAPEAASTLAGVADFDPAAPAADPGADRQAALRALRNLEATEARLERNARREADEMRARLVQELLPVLDNLDRTIRAAQAGRSDPAMVEGVRMVHHQLEGVLRGYGVERIDALGERFDPAIHEAISAIAVDDPQHHGAVIHQAEPGYRFAGRMLRPAKVTVGKLAAPREPRPVIAWR